MATVEKLVKHWCCNFCTFEWPIKHDSKPLQCPKCSRRHWDDGTLPANMRWATPVPIWKPQLAPRISFKEGRRRIKKQERARAQSKLEETPAILVSPGNDQ
jgi:hypothetical protein